MPNGVEKRKLQSEYAKEIETYKEKKSTLYRHKVISPEEIQDFLERFEEIKANLERAVKQEEKLSSHSRRLYKLKYNIQLAQNRKYCYGPEFKEQEDDLEQESTHSEKGTNQFKKQQPER